MSFLLDTNVCIAYLNGTSSAIKEHFRTKHSSDLFLCSVVKAELIYGAYKSQRPEENLKKVEHFLGHFPSLPFDDKAAEFYGKIRASLEKQGQIIGPNDLMIASIALANQKILITNNTREFSRVEGLNLGDWIYRLP